MCKGCSCFFLLDLVNLMCSALELYDHARYKLLLLSLSLLSLLLLSLLLLLLLLLKGMTVCF